MRRTTMAEPAVSTMLLISEASSIASKQKSHKNQNRSKHTHAKTVRKSHLGQIRVGDFPRCAGIPQLLLDIRRRLVVVVVVVDDIRARKAGEERETRGMPAVSRAAATTSALSQSPAHKPRVKHRDTRTSRAVWSDALALSRSWRLCCQHLPINSLTFLSVAVAAAPIRGLLRLSRTSSSTSLLVRPCHSCYPPDQM